MKTLYYSTILTFSLLMLFGCGNHYDTQSTYLPGDGCEYAQYFGLSDSAGNINIIVQDSWEEENITGEGIMVIRKSDNKEYKRIICMSTSHIAYISALGLQERIVGVSGSRYISTPEIIQGISDGKIADIGFESSLNYELLLSLRPDIVFTYGISGENNQYIEKIRQFGIEVVALGDYLEEHPLGKLEYLKLFGELLDRRGLADSLYISSRDRYLNHKQTASSASNYDVLVNAPWKDVWYIPGEKSYMTILIEDAGGRILGSESNESRTKSLSIEKVYSFASKAQFWLNPNNALSIEELKGMNPLFENIQALKEGKVYNNTKMNTPGGGSGFWEQGVIEPDIILLDLISILHPELAPGHIPKYYIRLK
ncbi:MAG: hypothetical protein CVT93_07900 [Bacteroidetes bacterium HGW-Bacteroidetes-10]|nr:MAG: hypothetical protein CVT93_07900 [Bacteroidetes bacterium HGW-Bacteroidetes-10]